MGYFREVEGVFEQALVEVYRQQFVRQVERPALRQTMDVIAQQAAHRG